MLDVAQRERERVTGASPTEEQAEMSEGLSAAAPFAKTQDIGRHGVYQTLFFFFPLPLTTMSVVQDKRRRV